MYSESDIESAVLAGVLDPPAAAALRIHVADLRAAPAADEEQFRLLTGFNDIFVSIAGLLLLGAIVWLGGNAFGAPAVAAVAWGLAEYFTRQRRMALPSILLLLAFVAGVFATALVVAGVVGLDGDLGGWHVAVAAAAATGAGWLHWRRFRVPITVAILWGTALAALLTVVLALVPALREAIGLLALAAGVAVFAAAMRWDMADPLRQTRRSDVAFWLHLLAAPLLVHAVFSYAGTGMATAGEPGRLAALLVLALYGVLAWVALVIDRRALMVSALAYVLYALSSLLEKLGTVGTDMALTGLVIGSALLLLSALWPQARRVVLRPLPAGWRDCLPPDAVPR